MAPAVRTSEPRLSKAEELMQLPHETEAELLDGVLVPTTPAPGDHGSVQVRRVAALAPWVHEREAGEVFDSSTGSILRRNPDALRCPDVAFVAWLDGDATLDGGDVLPGFTLQIARIFAGLPGDHDAPGASPGAEPRPPAEPGVSPLAHRLQPRRARARRPRARRPSRGALMSPIAAARRLALAGLALAALAACEKPNAEAPGPGETGNQPGQDTRPGQMIDSATRIDTMTRGPEDSAARPDSTR